MWQKKHENSKTRSFRVSKVIDDFFKDTFVKNENSCITANDFLLNLIENSKEYKEYLQEKRKKDDEKQPSLF